MRFICFLFCVSLLVMPRVHASSFSCAIPSQQTPCSAITPTSTTQILPSFGFNPIHLGHGTKHLHDIDLYASAEHPDLFISRYYQSSNPALSSLGAQWTLNYDIQLLKELNQNYIRLPDGAKYRLTPDQGQLIQSTFYSIWQPSHSSERWVFNQYGWLIKLEKTGYASVFIERHDQPDLLHHIKQVRQGSHQLDFQYTTHQSLPQLELIHTPAGTIRYIYENPSAHNLFRLTAVHYPDQRQLHYHYEVQYQAGNPWAITGKSIQFNANQNTYRLRYWVYNSLGQVIFMMAEAATLWIKLDYTAAQHTTISSPQGHTTIFFTEPSKTHIQAVRGALCWGCPPHLEHTKQRITFASFSIDYDQNQQIRFLQGDFPGWPKLQLHYNAQGQLTQWQNQLQATTQLFYKQGYPSRIQFANGDQQHVQYNAFQQPETLHYSNQETTSQSTIHRPSPAHLVIENENETEHLQVNETGQVLHRAIKRAIPTANHHLQWHYEEHFDYNQNQQLQTHLLPEGGALHYQWDQNQLLHIHWTNPKNQKQLVIEKIPKGYRFSNQSVLIEHHSAHYYYQFVGTTERSWWQLLLKKGALGLVQQVQHQFFDNPDTDTTYLHYNKKQQLIAHQKNNQHSFYAWHEHGGLAKKHPPILSHIKRDKSGLATQFKLQEQNYILRYNPARQLHLVHLDQKPIQKNLYNAAGFRVYSQNYPQAKTHFFLYHQQQLVAEFQSTEQTKLPIHATHPVSRRYIYLGHRPIAMINYEQDPQGELLVMHSDHLGAVHIISDQQQQIVWQANYDIFGKAQLHQEQIQFNLRRAGQYYDSSTGWHQNIHRMYLPDLGQFLEPEPLGPTTTSQLLGYVRQQPLNHFDPLGLLLFSFDGTRYDATQNGVIHQFNQSHADTSFYQAGPGNPNQVDWDAMVAFSTQQIVQTQWQRLLSYLQENTSHTPIPIDIIGFSRGAAIALHFANQIMAHTQQGVFSLTTNYGEQIKACIQPRFMGLLDTVAQMGVLGTLNHRYDFSVSPAWQWVVHGVALHEYRFIMPLRLLSPQDNTTQTGFIGSHADLGGGYKTELPEQFIPLSHVALAWLRWQAQGQGLQFHANSAPHTTAPHAFLHDHSSLVEIDRRIENHGLAFQPNPDMRYTQSQHPLLGHHARLQVQQFLNSDLSAQQLQHNQRAVVDLPNYYRWLEEQIQWRPD